MNSFYVYIYLDPRKRGLYDYGKYKFAYEPFYVGKGTGKRIYSHLEPRCLKEKTFKSKKIKKIIKVGHNVKNYILKINNLTEQEAFDLETKLINLIGRYDLNKGPLTNHTNGGEGVSGLNHSEETKEKLRQVRSNQKPTFKDKTHSKESKEKMSKKRKNNPTKYWKGKKFSEEHKKKLSKSHKGKIPWNKGLKNKQDAWNKGMTCSEETKEKLRQARKKQICILICKECNEEFESKSPNRHKCNKCRGIK